MEQLFEALKKHEYTISSCESLTGGLFLSSLTSVPNVSSVLKGGIVSYTNEIKEKIVGVEKEVLEKFGAVSFETAQQMAENVKRKFNTDVAVSFTGNAGPSALEGKAAGLVYTCIIVKDDIYLFEDLIHLERNQLRNDIVVKTKNRLINILG